MDFDAAADFLEQGDGQLAAEMLAKFFEAGEEEELSGIVGGEEFVGKKRKAETADEG